jgi:signal transduction histidine kinase
MNAANAILKIALWASAVVGLVVFSANRRRRANQAFLLLTLTIAAWLGSVLEVFHSSSTVGAAQWIRSASITGGFLPVAISILRVSIVYPNLSILGLGRRVRIWLSVYAMIALYSATPLYLIGAEIPPQGVPNARYGALSSLFPIYFIGGLICVLISLLRDRRKASGVTRVELEYVLAGLGCLFGAGIFAGVLPLVTHNSQIVSVAPLWFVTMNVVIAYGIATRRILSVGALLRRAVSYLLLLIYLGGVYWASWWCSTALLRAFSLDAGFAAPLIGTLCVALSIGRAQSFLQLFVRKLFLNLHRLDLRSTLKGAERLLTQVTTTEKLLEGFLPLLSQAAGTDLLTLCLFDHSDSKQVWSTREPAAHGMSAGYFDSFRDLSAPLALSTMPRRHSNAKELEAAARLREMSGALAVSIRNGRTEMGVVVLGEKLSGQMYDQEELESIQLLANRLGVALENALLYTDQRRSKEYLQSLLGELTSGVLACDQRGIITVCNGEAERLLKQPAEAVIGKSVEILPAQFLAAFQETLAAGFGVRDQGGILNVAESEIPIRFSTQVFSDPSQGAFLVFSDLTRVKQLEEQLRRADRLAVLGTLAAGLAHEIRNPLAPIKTFVALIPERAADSGFLDRFTEIVGAQVARIERLVSQLLSFSRVGVPRREEVACHGVLQDILALLAHDMNKRGIDIVTAFEAPSDSVLADRQQLEQVILNTLMNAAEAMPQGGEIRVATINREGLFELSIQDEGPGVPLEVLPRVFDPFVTTKDSGTGLGLSIVYGIVAEHGGTIDIVNGSKGATVQVRLPTHQTRKLAA